MAERMPPTLEQVRQLNRSLTEKILDRAASDPRWKQQLIDDPQAAMHAAGFPETQQLQQIEQGARQAQQEETEVAGQVCRYGTLIDCIYRCIFYTSQWWGSHIVWW